MKALDQAEQDPQAMALRYMRADRGERPMLNGIAAVYVFYGAATRGMKYRQPSLPALGCRRRTHYEYEHINSTSAQGSPRRRPVRRHYPRRTGHRPERRPRRIRHRHAPL